MQIFLTVNVCSSRPNSSKLFTARKPGK